MGPDSNGECSCRPQYRCKGADGNRSSSSSSEGCRNDQRDSRTRSVPNDSCYYSKDGTCDEPEQYCGNGTDCTDCGNCGPLNRAAWHWHPADCPSCVCERWCNTNDAPTIDCRELGLKNVSRIENKNAAVLDLRGNAISALNASLFSGMTMLNILYFPDNKISELAEDLFVGLTRLTKLSINGNLICALPTAIFAGLSTLSMLELQHNLIDVLPPKVFEGLTSLTKLDLSHNLITELSDRVFTGLSFLTTLYLRYNVIGELPLNIFDGVTRVEQLFLNSNTITRMPPNIFKGMKAISVLTVSNNRIRELPVDIFSGITAMKSLGLSSNLISELPAAVFTGLSFLTTLYLHYNVIGELPLDIFDGLSRLEKLPLENNKITRLPLNIFKGMTAMSVLTVRNNRIRDLPVGIFRDMTAITNIDLGNNLISELPLGVFKGLSRMDDLRINSNSISKLVARVFNDMTTLGRLDLTNNSITQLPDQIFSRLSSMEILDLLLNKITVLPKSVFASMTNMTHFDIHSNGVSELPEQVFAGFTMLWRLDLSLNLITKLPNRVFAGLTSLVRLILFRNKITEIPEQAFADLTKIEVLYLNANLLNELPHHVFAGLTNMHNLALDGNTISKVHEDAFTGLPLITLRLDDNKITELPLQVFSGLSNLTDLLLSTNRITSLPNQIFQSLTSLESLSIKNNHLSYDTPDTHVYATLTNLEYLDLTNTSLTMISTTMFSQLSHSLQELHLVGNNISRVDGILEEIHQQRLQHPEGSYNSYNKTKTNFSTLTMEGNPSQCWIATPTLQNAKGTVICRCAPNYVHVSASSTSKTKYFCQQLGDAGIIPQAVVALRSQFVLKGPANQLPPSQQDDGSALQIGESFAWNGHNIISDEDVAISFHWKPGSNSEGSFEWKCLTNACKTIGNITNPPAGQSAAYFGFDPPNEEVTIKYNVSSVATTPITYYYDGARITTIKLVYSAFHLPKIRFDDPFAADRRSGIAVPAHAARNQAPRRLQINESVTAINIKYTTHASIEWLAPTMNASVDANPLIPTSIHFDLADNMCEQQAPNALKVSEIYSQAQGHQRDVVGWEIVVGDAEAMRNTPNGTLRPCTAVLQALDSVTGEILNITKIEANITDCFDNNYGSSINQTSTESLSCSGHGTCNDDADPYDGIFKGCKCAPTYAGKRCDVKLIQCDELDQAFNVYEGVCKTFTPKLKVRPLRETIKGPNVIYTAFEAVNSTTTFTEDDTVHIAGVAIDPSASTYSSGDASKVRFVLSDDAPSSFFVSGKTGEISAYLTIPENGAAPSLDGRYIYTFQLLARDELGATAAVRWMKLSVNPKLPDIVVPTLLGCTAFAVVLGITIQQLRQRYLAKQDAIAALVRARKAFGLVSLESNEGISVNSGDLVGVITNPAFLGLSATNHNGDDDAGVALLIEPANGYSNNQLTYDDDDGDDGESGEPPSETLTPTAVRTNVTMQKKQRRDNQLSKFVAPTISLGKSTLAAKGLDVLLGIDPKTYMHVKRKVKVMLKEFAKHGTDEDNRNLRTLIDGTYKHPPNGDGSPLTQEEIRGQSITLDELMACSIVQDAGLERHHVLALRLYTTSTYSSINNPMRQSPPVLPHPFAATLYYISDALSKLREVQGKDPALRNETLVFWRGMKNLQMADEFMRTGGSEMACMSTTSSREVAEDFALSKCPLLFKFVSKSFMSHGADIGFLSVYPSEKEVLFPPLTYLRPVRITQETIGTTVYTVVEVEPVFPK